MICGAGRVAEHGGRTLRLLICTNLHQYLVNPATLPATLPGPRKTLFVEELSSHWPYQILTRGYSHFGVKNPTKKTENLSHHHVKERFSVSPW
jgi:hypothetical protein